MHQGRPGHTESAMSPVRARGAHLPRPRLLRLHPPQPERPRPGPRRRLDGSVFTVTKFDRFARNMAEANDILTELPGRGVLQRRPAWRLQPARGGKVRLG